MNLFVLNENLYIYTIYYYISTIYSKQLLFKEFKIFKLNLLGNFKIALESFHSEAMSYFTNTGLRNTAQGNILCILICYKNSDQRTDFLHFKFL